MIAHPLQIGDLIVDRRTHMRFEVFGASQRVHHPLGASSWYPVGIYDPTHGEEPLRYKIPRAIVEESPRYELLGAADGWSTWCEGIGC